MDTSLDSAVPSRLQTPPSSGVKQLPPAETRPQELPFEELTWENFEKLCFRLARLEENVEYCRLYGKPGQEQEGIDLYARRESEEKYTVYQCKREKKFGTAQIKQAVSKFLDGDNWPRKTRTFVLCTSESMKSKDLSDELEAQYEVLKKEGISLLSWDRDELSAKLKELPKLIDDFFSRAWVEAFCGKEQADALGTRLDAGQVAEFRAKLGVFYRRVFNTHDPGLPVVTLGESNSLALEDRYVVPDVYDWRPVSTGPLEEAPRVQRPSQALSGEFEPEGLLNDAVGPDLNDQRRSEPSRSSVSVRNRRTAENWLMEAPRNVVLGEPGSGKSSLLRFLAIDLLSESPKLSSLAEKWGEFLPVWVPFALWTKMISPPGDPTCSLRQVLFKWLESWDEERLWPLLEQALEDERVLLLVDGLDEWATEAAAKAALERLQVFVDQRNVPAVLVSRPHGFAQLGMQAEGWQLGKISDFSAEQQELLVRIWFTHRLKSLYRQNLLQVDEEAEQKAGTETQEFLAQLERSEDLRELARTPLLLCLLIYLRLHHASLPQSRFEAYETLVKHLILEHPERRRRAASLTEELLPELSNDEVRDVLANLAYRLQASAAEGMIARKEALSVTKEYLRDGVLGLGLERSDARRLSREIVDVSESETGLIVKKSSDTIGFFHRAFQEYLAAWHLSRRPFDEQLSIVEERCSDPQWREVILGTLYLTKRAEEANRFAEHLRRKTLSKVEQHYVNSLLAEVAFGDFNCTPALARDIARETFERIELGPWMPHRRDLLQHVLEGLRSTKVREAVKAKLRNWFPYREPYTSSLFRVIGTWPLTPEAVECLWKGIHDEEPSNQRAAARALAALASGDAEVGDQLAVLARSAIEPKVRAMAIEALLKGWEDHAQLDSILDDARASVSPELRSIAILGKIMRNKQTSEDLEELMRLGTWDSAISYYWKDDVGYALVNGWASSPEVKAACFRSLGQERQNRRDMRSENWQPRRDRQQLESSIALRVLLEGFPQDDDVARYCAEELLEEKYPFLSSDRLTSFDLLSRNFKDHPLVVEAVEEWIPKQDFWDPEVSRAALVGRTSPAKAKLLSRLSTSGTPHWAASALLEGWGMGDREVAPALTELANGPADRASRIGYLMPQIVEDEGQCWQRLVELLIDPECMRVDFVMQGLVQLGEEGLTPEVVDAMLRLPAAYEYTMRGEFGREAISLLIANYPSDPRVRSLAERELTQRAGSYAAVARGFGNDPEIRQNILDIATPFPAQLREMIATRLGTGIGEESFAISLLELYDYDTDAIVKTQASTSYHKRLRASNQDVEPAISCLSERIVARGPDLEERRQAAFCGLAELDRLDVMVEAKEDATIDGPWSISVRGLEPNVPLIKCILANWDHIRNTLGEEFFTKLRDQPSDELSMWEQLCPFIDEFPSAQEEALRFLESRIERTAGPNVLHFLGRMRPRSRLLLSYCFETLHIGDDQADCSGSEDALAAAELLGSHFGSDNNVLARIASGQHTERIQEKDVLALCEGWPESEELEQLFNLVRHQNPPLSYTAYFQLITRKSPSEVVFGAVTGVLANFNRYLSRHPQLVTHSVLRRLRNDEDLEFMLSNRLQDEPSLSEVASIPRLISAARGLPPGLRKWCSEEADAQLNGAKSPEIGIDLLSGERRPIAHSLLDALNQDWA